MTWIQELSKEELEERLAELGQDGTGNIGDLRTRLREFVKTHPDHELVTAWKGAPTPRSDKEGGATSAKHQTTATVQSPSSCHCTVPSYHVINQIRKWNCHFQGKDVYEFIERIHELRRAYQIRDEDLLLGLPELLRGTALKWYRHHPQNWQTWSDFITDLRNAYEPPFAKALLHDEITHRRQRPGESMRDYVIALQTLFYRMGEATTEQILDRALLNLRADYQSRIEPSSVRTLGDLILAGERVEEWQQEWGNEQRRANATSRPLRQTAAAITDVPFSRENSCWRCKQPGHSRRSCTALPRLFCSYCGTDGVTFRTCPCARSANDQRAGSSKSPAQRLADGRIKLKVYAANTTFSALLDTGAAASYVDEETARQCQGQGWRTQIEYLAAVLADGKESQINGSLEGDVQIQGKTVRHRFLVFPTLPHAMLIGADLLNKMDFRATINGRTIWPPPTGNVTIPRSWAGRKRSHVASSEGLRKPTRAEESALRTFIVEELPNSIRSTE